MAKCTDVIKRYRNVPERVISDTWQHVLRSGVKGEYLRDLLMSHLHGPRFPPADPGACAALLAALSAKGRTKKMKNVIAQIFEELGPYLETSLVDAAGLSEDSVALVHMLDALLVGGLVPLLEPSAIDKLIMVLEDKQRGAEERGKVLAFLGRAASRYLSIVLPRHAESVTRLLAGWLQAPAAGLGGRSGEHLFTVLSPVNSPTAAHLMSVHAFSSVREWLAQLTLPGQRVPSEVSLLLDAICAYCDTAVEQCLGQAPEDDASLQKAVLCEILDVMHHVATLDPSRVSGGLALAQKVHTVVGSRFRSDYQDVSVLTLSLQFLLRFGRTSEHGLQQACERFLGDTVYRSYSSGLAAWDVARLLCQEAPRLSRAGLLQRFHPNLLKLVACHPATLVEEFLQLVPSLLSAENTVQVWSSLVDLPLLSATLLLHQAPVALQLEPARAASAAWGELLESVRSSEHQPAYSYMLRRESSLGDAPSVRAYLKLMEGVSSHALVAASSQVAPLLLGVFLDAVQERADLGATSQLLAAILDRLALLYRAPGYHAAVNKLVSRHVLELVRLCPDVVFVAQTEIVAFLSVLGNAASSCDLYTHLMWLAGEYVAPGLSERCSHKALESYYECVECCLYESLSKLPSQPVSCRLLSVMCSALAKLASRSEDLIPRVMLCLRKVAAQVPASTDQEGREVVLARVQELMSVLRNPTIASSVLSSHAEIPGMTAVIRTITQLNT
ncbi:AP-5 complex subunit zeta-1-like [Bacillus rossius redtenbacheri]|uniref:AP-5 complex subunit zeta-1-like n=1 Tax=Bacillus rossius redtenbacheri TaxID=93214 RepID=UPI002FDCCFA4